MLDNHYSSFFLIFCSSLDWELSQQNVCHLHIRANDIAIVIPLGFKPKTFRTGI